MRRFAIVTFAVVASILVVAAPVGAATSVEVVSINNTDADFDNATALDTVDVTGSGGAASVELNDSGVRFNDSFDDETADGGLPDDWESTDSGTFAVSTDTFSSSPNSFKIEPDGNNIARARPSEQPYASAITDTVSVKINHTTDTNTGRLHLFESASFRVTIAIRNGDLQYFDGSSWNTIATEPDSNEWVSIKVFDINATSDTFAVKWSEPDGASGFSTGLDMRGDMTDGYTDAQLGSQGTGGTTYFDDYQIGGRVGTYVGDPHDVSSVQNGFTNITVSDAEAIVTWQENSSGSWSDIRSDTYSTTGNKSVDISSATDDEIRVNVTFTNESTTGDPVASLHDEGVEATVHDPEFDNSTASPDGEDLTESTQTLEIQLNDTDFPTAQGDSVTVEFFTNESAGGTSAGTDTLTANGTASTSHTFSTGGNHRWWAEATDDYGLTNRSANFTVTVPANVSIREESPDHPLIQDGTVEIMFFEQEDDNPTIVNRSVSDGNVSLAGLPVGSTFVMTAKIEGYYNRTIIIDDIFEQSTIFLINDSVEARQVTFTIDDDTGQFTTSDTEILIEHPINESLYASGGFSWVVVAGEETGALDSATFWMAWEERYRIKVRTEGDTRILGAFTPVVNETITLRPATPDINVTDEEGYAWNVTAPEDGSEVVFEFNDPDDNTTDLRLRIYEQGNESNEVHDQTYAGPHGYLKVTQPLTGDQVNQTWTVDWNATRQGSTIGGERTAGRQVIDQIPQLDTVWQHAIAVLAVILTGALFSARNVETGAMTTAFVGGGFWMAGWLPTAAGGAITVAIFIVLAYKVSTRRVT